jgi:hypothetical protein
MLPTYNPMSDPADSSSSSSSPAGVPGNQSGKAQYEYRLAFDVWANDLRNQAMTLENWPYGELDDKTVDGIVRSLDVQAETGYNVVDLAGLWTTYGWPLDPEKVVDKVRQQRINQIINAAHQRKIKVVVFPSGILNWGMDQIVSAHPELNTDNKHWLNPFMEESWAWQYKIFDYVANNYEIDGYHLEAADQGRCRTPQCMKKWPDDVGYFSDVTTKLADHIRQKYPRMLLMATLQGFAHWGQSFNDEQKGYLIDLTKRVDCLFDQGHHKTYIPPGEWHQFIPKLHCAYGTSGGLWIYVNERWERARWFLPYTSRTGEHIKALYQAGGRGVMYYQGPVENPGIEVNIAFGGRLMNDVGKNVEDVLTETLEHLYHPKTQSALHRLVAVYQKAENSYFGQWKPDLIEAAIQRPVPSNFHITNSFGASPGAAEYLMEPYLDSTGRLQYKQALIEMYRELLDVEPSFDDGGRIGRIKYGISETLVDLNTIAKSKDEKQVWDDRNVGLQY